MNTLVIIYKPECLVIQKSECLYGIKSMEAAENVIRRRNAVNIRSATWNGKAVDIDRLKSSYSRPRQFAERFTLKSIINRFEKQKVRPFNY